jgi:hypothetical protein
MINIANPNFLNAPNFKFVLHQLPHLQFFILDVTMPEISIGNPQVGNQFATLQLTGDRLNYSPLSITFAVDENMDAWKGVHYWMESLGKPTSFEERRRLGAEGNKEKVDGTLSLLTSNFTKNQQIHFADLFPISLSGFTMASNQDNGTSPLKSTVVFRYQHFKFL